jgi:hypothetical protein
MDYTIYIISALVFFGYYLVDMLLAYIRAKRMKKPSEW